MVCDHVCGEHLVEACTGHFGHFVVVGLLLGIWSGRRIHAHPFCSIHGLLIGRGVIGRKHFAERLDGIALAILLRQVPHTDFSEIAFDRLLKESFARLVFRRGVAIEIAIRVAVPSNNYVLFTAFSYLG